MHEFNISNEVKQAVETAQAQLVHIFERIEGIEQHNQWKVLSAFQQEGVAARHFNPSTGYGYDDIGRDTLERVFARAFGAEDALVRPQIANGTHAIYIAMSGMLTPGDKLLSITGAPYDTIRPAIAGGPGAMSDFGIRYEEIPLLDGQIDVERMLLSIEKEPPKLVFAQRSRGYAWREAISVDKLGEVFSKIRAIHPDVRILVDNCYGEFTQTQEPTCQGADIIAGSLIKNPGGGLAPTGGYIAGRECCVERIANRLTVPGTGREVGSYASGYLPFYQGFFLAPHITAQGIKTAALFARVLENEGYTTMPHSEAPRADIIQALRFEDRDSLIAFIQCIQRAAPVDCFVVPEPWQMPGYKHRVVMAAGAFIQGSSIEMSADAPICEPYVAYIQGALTYAHGKIAAAMALQELRFRGKA